MGREDVQEALMRTNRTIFARTQGKSDWSGKMCAISRVRGYVAFYSFLGVIIEFACLIAGQYGDCGTKN